MMRRIPTFIPNTDAAEELLTSDEALSFVVMTAQAAAEIARDTMPVLSGWERDHVVSGEAKIEDGNSVAWFGSSSSTWHFVEFGSAKNQPHRVFRNAAEQAGLKFTEEGR